MTSRIAFVGATAALLLALTACSSPETPAPATGSDSSPTSPAEETPAAPATPPAEATFGWDHITSCEQVSAPIAAYTDGLTLVIDEIDEYGVTCKWEDPDPTVWEDLRSVSVNFAENWEVLTPDQLAMTESLTAHPDAQLESLGGIAFSMDMQTSLTGVSSTMVSVPGVDVNVSASEFATLPPLRDAAAIAVAKQLLGI